jgi:hypothetical protein
LHNHNVRGGFGRNYLETTKETFHYLCTVCTTSIRKKDSRVPSLKIIIRIDPYYFVKSVFFENRLYTLVIGIRLVYACYRYTCLLSVCKFKNCCAVHTCYWYTFGTYIIKYEWYMLFWEHDICFFSYVFWGNVQIGQTVGERTKQFLVSHRSNIFSDLDTTHFYFYVQTQGHSTERNNVLYKLILRFFLNRLLWVHLSRFFFFYYFFKAKHVIFSKS